MRIHFIHFVREHYSATLFATFVFDFRGGEFPQLYRWVEFFAITINLPMFAKKIFTEAEKLPPVWFDMMITRVKIDDMNVSSSECHFESRHHAIPSAHA